MRTYDLYSYVVAKNTLKYSFIGSLKYIVASLFEYRTKSIIDGNQPWILKSVNHHKNSYLKQREPDSVIEVYYDVGSPTHAYNICYDIACILIWDFLSVSTIFANLIGAFTKTDEMLLHEKAAKKFFDQRLNSYSSEVIYIYNYYGPIMQGLIESARGFNIRVVELQHGSLGDVHGCYNGSLKNNAWLPDEFIAWNKYSSEFITKSLGVVSKVLRLEFTHEAGSKILLTLGSDTELLEDFVKSLSAIYKVKVRAHPRHDQPVWLDNYDIEICDSRESIVRSFDSVRLHITKGSGCFFQAMEVGIPTLLISSSSRDWYDYFKETNLVYYAESFWMEKVSEIFQD